MINEHRSLFMAAVMALTIIVLRFLPFVVFGKRTPRAIVYLGEVLPYAVMGMLIVYCFRNTTFLKASSWVPALISAAIVIVLHKWRHNTLLSMVTGTLSYMLMVQFVF